MNPINSKKSFTLIEVITTVAIVSIGIVGILKFIPYIISGITVNASRATAVYLAQEGLEIIRNVRDTNWLEANNKDDGTSWKEGLLGCYAGCEVDYFCVSVEDPTTSNPAGHNCFGSYGSAGNYLKFDSNNFYNYATGADAKFKRKITIEEKSAYLTVTTYVYWQEKGKSYQFSAQEKIYQW
jgi:type II secretory pathway pseudopilin PulG